MPLRGVVGGADRDAVIQQDVVADDRCFADDDAHAVTDDDANAGGARGNRLWWTIALFLFVGVDGVGFQMRGALLPSLEASFQVSPGFLGLVATAGTAGFVAAVLTTGAVAGRVDVRKAMLASTALVGASVFAIVLAPACVR
jgi:fucose permease